MSQITNTEIDNEISGELKQEITRILYEACKKLGFLNNEEAFWVLIPYDPSKSNIWLQARGKIGHISAQITWPDHVCYEPELEEQYKLLNMMRESLFVIHIHNHPTVPNLLYGASPNDRSFAKYWKNLRKELFFKMKFFIVQQDSAFEYQEDGDKIQWLGNIIESKSISEKEYYDKQFPFDVAKKMMKEQRKKFYENLSENYHKSFLNVKYVYLLWENLIKAKMDKNFNFVDYILAYFDLMGQKERLDLLRKIPINEQERIQFNLNKSQTCDAVRCIRKGLRDSFDAYRKEAISAVDNAILLEKVESKYQFNFYSDAFAISCRYANNINKPLIQHVFGQLVSLSFMMITCLRNETPVRGGIEVGKVFEWPEGCNIGIYGPVMLDVEELEKKIAFYPRMIIGENLYKCINNWSTELKNGDIYYNDFIPIIESCKGMIIEDRDGSMILDYLGTEIYKLAKSDPRMIKYVKLGWNFVNYKYEQLKNNKKSNLGMKYFLLKEYYASRLAIWNLA